MYHRRGDLPIAIDHHGGFGNRVKWTTTGGLAHIDYNVVLPIFFDGLRETQDPCRFLAVQGTIELLEASPEKILGVLPQIILPL